MTESEIIDEILRATKEGRQDSDEAQNSPLYRTALKTIAGYKLIRQVSFKSGRGSYQILEERGNLVLNAGGFDKWKSSAEKRENELHQAALDSAKATVDAAESSGISAISAKSSTRASWVSAIFAVIAVIFSIFQYVKSTDMQSEINELKTELRSHTQQLQVQKRVFIKVCQVMIC